MALKTKWTESCGKWLGSHSYDTVLNLLCHRYVIEKQRAMRYRQHADQMHYSQFRDTLLGLAREEEKHAELIAARIMDLGEKLPDVIPVHFAAEQNSWSYLRTDLEEEQRCAGELTGDLPAVRAEFPAIADLFERLDNDSKRHRSQIRDMMARSDPQSGLTI